VIPYFNDARVKITAVTAGADGAFSVATRVPGYYSPGPWVVVVVGAGGDLARASITVTEAPSVAPERLTVTPTTGAVGTRFAATGTGLPPGRTLRAFTTESAKGPTGHFRQVAQLVVAADGRATFPIDTTGYDPDGYDLTLIGPEATLSDPGGVPSGFPLVIAQFVVTAPGAMPGLPNTGGGAARAGEAGSGVWGWAALFLGLGAWGGGLLLGTVTRRRRRS